MGFPRGTKLLSRLGLTIRQAEVYLSLVECGVSSVKEISKNSSVPREDLYRILQTLHEMGLVEKEITFPVTFKAVPIPDALSLLHNRRIKETSELETEERNFLAASMSNLAGIISKKEPSLFALVPQKEAVVMKIKELSENAKYSIDVVNSRRRHLLSASVFRKEIYKALDRGVKFRVIAQKDKDEGLLPKAQVDIESHPGFKIKYVLTKPSAMVSIFDNREVLIVEDESVDQITAPTLWSNNKSLVTLAQNYFDMLWHAQTE